jgi:O-antigen ligase
MSVNEARSWLGSGYRAFWIDANTKYFFEVFAWAQDADGNLSDSFNGPDHSHSGYMDTYLELGLVGVTMLGVVLFSALFNLRRALNAGAVAIGSVFAAIITFVLIYAVTEKSILQQSEDLWFFFVTIYLLTVRETIFKKSPELHKPDARVS